MADTINPIWPRLPGDWNDTVIRGGYLELTDQDEHILSTVDTTNPTFIHVQDLVVTNDGTSAVKVQFTSKPSGDGSVFVTVICPAKDTRVVNFNFNGRRLINNENLGVKRLNDPSGTVYVSMAGYQFDR